MSLNDFINKRWSEICDEEQEQEAPPTRRATKEKMRTDSRENSSSRKRSKYDTEKRSKPHKNVEVETDPAVLLRRQKQIDYGQNTIGYHNYLQKVPKDKRTKYQPRTPDKFAKYSRRCWDMLIKTWRKKLHEYDTDHNDQKHDDGDNDDKYDGGSKHYKDDDSDHEDEDVEHNDNEDDDEDSEHDNEDNEHAYKILKKRMGD